MSFQILASGAIIQVKSNQTHPEENEWVSDTIVIHEKISCPLRRNCIPVPELSSS
jgi:hypothetical protein